MLKKYRVKNYKGNIKESIANFLDNHKTMKVVEALEVDDTLNITAADIQSSSIGNYTPETDIQPQENIKNPIIEFGCKLLMFGIKVHLWHLNTKNEAAHLALKELYEACDAAADKLLETTIGIFDESISRFDFNIKNTNLEFADIAEIEAIIHEASQLDSFGNRGIDSVIDSFSETCNSVVYKLKRLK